MIWNTEDDPRLRDEDIPLFLEDSEDMIIEMGGLEPCIKRRR